MRAPLVQGQSPLTRINVTPIIDVALVLVIILLITAPMLTVADLDVNLPRARARDIEDRDFVSVSVSRGRVFAVDDEVLADADQLASVLRAHLAARGGADRLVVVRADAGLAHATVREALEAARAGGATRLAVAVRQGGKP
ncbi:MAG: biopolymer transporter ExbD [Candidatus Krumholzibacteriia bacterium]